ncbi:MAG: type I methionyl aminopeptidase [Candidatus Levybacteria bacterium RIFCSPHIGHO2_01_FULL_36_15]|nr:MAG: type I methionyl aminopeptidase [Candidatus Levybacteria bacterium RIFCSPHIGHO2_01_FULL_36_15]OGH38374.1 MAG: type I methionyl aminopeptidase [Candidatus Levybacteria bacterium RIFCSPLOWO2_01_FULL_36_10]
MKDKKIENMKTGGKILGDVLSELVKSIRPGMTEIGLDRQAEELITAKGAKPGFKLVPGYKHTLCVSTNDAVVHGIPSSRVFKPGDVVGIDCGVYFGGYHTDMAQTVYLASEGPKNAEIERFLKAGEDALFAGIDQARGGNRVGNISASMQAIIEGSGFSVVRSLVGHGVGRELHEKPDIPGFLSSNTEETPLLKPGMTIAIEIIYNMGGAEVVYKGEDDWTIVTADGKISGLFERSILITDRKPVILTPLASNR